MRLFYLLASPYWNRALDSARKQSSSPMEPAYRAVVQLPGASGLVKDSSSWKLFSMTLSRSPPLLLRVLELALALPCAIHISCFKVLEMAMASHSSTALTFVCHSGKSQFQLARQPGDPGDY